MLARGVWAMQALLLTLLLCGCQSMSGTTDAPPGDEREKVERLLTLIDQRLDVAVMVAQTKWNTGAPINDPVREQKILDDLSASLPVTDDAGKLFMRRFFQAQFDAGKIIQLDLHAQWRAQGRPRFDNPPDLARDIRPALDRLTPLLIDAVEQVHPLLKKATVRQYIRLRGEILVRSNRGGGVTVREEALRVLFE